MEILMLYSSQNMMYLPAVMNQVSPTMWDLHPQSVHSAGILK